MRLPGRFRGLPMDPGQAMSGRPSRAFLVTEAVTRFLFQSLLVFTLMLGAFAIGLWIVAEHPAALCTS